MSVFVYCKLTSETFQRTNTYWLVLFRRQTWLDIHIFFKKQIVSKILTSKQSETMHGALITIRVTHFKTHIPYLLMKHIPHVLWEKKHRRWLHQVFSQKTAKPALGLSFPSFLLDGPTMAINSLSRFSTRWTVYETSGAVMGNFGIANVKSERHGKTSCHGCTLGKAL